MYLVRVLVLLTRVLSRGYAEVGAGMVGRWACLVSPPDKSALVQWSPLFVALELVMDRFGQSASRGESLLTTIKISEAWRVGCLRFGSGSACFASCVVFASR